MTDLLVLLIHHVNEEHREVFLCTEPKKNAKECHCVRDKACQKILGKEVIENVLFAHALKGRGTTCGMYSVGTVESLKIMAK